MQSVAWTTKAGSYPKAELCARALLGGPVGAGVIVYADDPQTGKKIAALEMDVAAAMALRDELDLAIAKAPAKLRRPAAAAANGNGEVE